MKKTIKVMRKPFMEMTNFDNLWKLGAYNFLKEIRLQKTNDNNQLKYKGSHNENKRISKKV